MVLPSSAVIRLAGSHGDLFDLAGGIDELPFLRLIGCLRRRCRIQRAAAAARAICFKYVSIAFSWVKGTFS